MSDLSPLSMNGTDPAERLEAQLLAVARALPYPATPNLAPAVLARTRAALPSARPVGAAAAPRPATRRAPAWQTRPLGLALAAVLVVAISLLAVPAVRSGVIDFLELGSVRILFGPTATPTLAATPAATLTGTPRPTATLRPTITPLASVLDLAGETTLADARASVNLPLRLPTYPAGLGEPDAVFVQDLEGEAVVFVWVAPDDPSQVVMSLHILSTTQLTEKMMKHNPASVEFTRVNGREAFWTTGPYYVVARSGFYAEMRLITGHVLVWYEGEITYRLETDLSVEEAVRIAESLE